VVDVIATDRKGAPVADLKQDDFQITEDGKQQSIRLFTFKAGLADESGQSAESKPAEPLPANVVTNVQRVKPGAPLAVLLLDGINTRLNNQQYAKQQLLEFLKRLPSDQAVAVYLLGSRLRLIQDFTSDPRVLKAVVQNLKDFRSPLMDNANGGPIKFWYEGVPLTPEIKKRALEFQQETESGQADQRLAITMAALNQLARNLAGYPGRKNLIWVSETFPLIIEANKVKGGPSAERTRRNYNVAVATTANRLSDARISVYPVDARGLMLADLYNVAAPFDERGDANGGRNGAQAGRSLDDTSNELMAARGTMEELAEGTGGRAFYNRNDLGKAVLEGISDGATYYTLGYYPANKAWDGNYHKIKVHVTRTGITLRYRLGYYALNPEDYSKQSQQRRDAEFSTTLNPDVPISTALPFTAAVLPASAKTANKTVVNFAVDVHAMSFSDEEGKMRAGLECAVRVFPAAGGDKALKTESDVIDANLPPESYKMVMQKGLPCRVVLDLSPGEYLLRLGVRDNRTGLIGTANIQWTVAAAPVETSGKDAPAAPHQ
jgi:VWFA-related protein